MENGVEPARIRWVMPRNAWLMNRANFQPGLDFERSLPRSSDLWRCSSPTKAILVNWECRALFLTAARLKGIPRASRFTCQPRG